MAFWERVGEAIGYGLAALVLGPSAAISRGERRRMRRTFAAWCDELDGVRLEARRGVLRRSIALTASTGRTPAEAELDTFARRARVRVAIPQLPAWVRARVLCEHGVRVVSETLDVESARALDAHVATGKLGDLRVVAIDVASDYVEVTAIAMTRLEAWRAIGEGVVALADWLVARWAVAYRG